MPQSKNKNKCKYKSRNQNGNAFLIILIAVVLFGALIFTFTRSGSKGSGNLTKQQAKIAAQEILNYARLVEGAVDRVRRNGCSENEISFENAVVSGYSNPFSPSDNSCHVFEDEGGKITYSVPNEKFLDQSENTKESYREYYFTSESSVSGVEQNKDEILLHLNWINQITCEEINKQLFNSTTITEDNANFIFTESGKAKGSLDSISSNINLTTNPIHAGQLTSCFTSENNGGFHFYHVLLAR